MFDKIRNVIEDKKATYVHKKVQAVRALEQNLAEEDKRIALFDRHRKLMEKGQFDWMHEADTDKLDFQDIKNFLKDYHMLFNREIDKNFGLTQFFRKVFPPELIFLYFKNLNMSFGNRVYDESLRFKTNLLQNFKDLYLEGDFVYNYRIKYESGFDFTANTRNYLRAKNREEMLALYETSTFSLKEFLFFMLDNYYPRVGWRWIGASHFVYYLTLDIIVSLFELGYWIVDDLEQLFLKLYEISEVLVSLEKNSARDSEKLAANFNDELIDGFSKAREYLTLIIIHSYQLLIDNRVSKQKLDTIRFYFNLIITRYIFNSTKIKNKNLRKQNNLKQILYYLDSSNFELNSNAQMVDPNQPLPPEFVKIVESLDQMSNLIKDNDITVDRKASEDLLNMFLNFCQMLFKAFKQGEVSLETILASKLLKRIVPLVDILRDQFGEEAEHIIDLSFCILNKLCQKYPKLLESDYFKTIIKNFFEIEPFKILYTVSKLITVNDLKVNKYFPNHLVSIFEAVFKEMKIVFDTNVTANDDINFSHEIFISIMELFIKYFDHFNELKVDLEYIEMKMSVAYTINTLFMPILKSIIVEKKMIDEYQEDIDLSFKEILSKYQDNPTKRLTALRTKETYLLLSLFNSAMKNTFKTEQLIFKIENPQEFLILPINTPIYNEIIKLIDTSCVLSPNNILNDRLKYNKSKFFILMEDPFPVKDEDLDFLMDFYKRHFNYQLLKEMEGDKVRKYILEVALPSVYKFLLTFVFLNESQKPFTFEDRVIEIIDDMGKIFNKFFNETKEPHEFVDMILEAEISSDKEIYEVLRRTETSYTNYTKIKKIFFNIVAYIDHLYEEYPAYQPFINCYRRQHYVDEGLSTNFNENLEDIISKIIYISNIDDKESMTNMLLFCIEEFQKCTLSLDFGTFKKNGNFAFLKAEYFDLLCMLKIIFERNKAFKEKFIEIIEKEVMEKATDKFFSKFWEFYRDCLFFSAYNFFHNILWTHMSKLFVHTSDFLLELTNNNLDNFNPILKYLYDFELEINYSKKHTLFFQMYVILECLGNYNRLLYLQDIVRLEQKDDVFFVLEKLFDCLSNMLEYTEAQKKIYVYRIDIWMNLLIKNIPNLNSIYYTLKDKLLNYFLAIAGGQDSTIVKFYGANVNPEILKASINGLFEMLCNEYKLLGLVISRPDEVHKHLSHSKIYKIIQKMYKFYMILMRHDVQTNYLHSFMAKKLDLLESKNTNISYLVANNLLFFYYADKIYMKFEFDMDGQKCFIQEIIKDENMTKIFPLYVDLIKKGDLKLHDYLQHLIDPKDYNLARVNQKLSIILQTLKSKESITHDQQLVLNKIRDNDLDWVKHNLLE